ncbi:MAG: class I SAM-dependent methyltransferase [Candidatus Bathyarchaeota archaeon]|nr:class I SAM-dependent methyltransferase [Candidatus Bathyarchaeota archaeon]
MADAFGKAFMAYHRGEPSEHIVERDDGLVEGTECDMYFEEYNGWLSHERDAILEARGRVLDVGCGAGRVALWLQERGCAVVAIDVSPLALEVSRLRGVRDCRLMDARNLNLPDGYFDTIIMFGNNFGIAGGFEETRQMLAEFHRVTKKDGTIIASTRDPLKTDNPAHLAYHERNRRRGRPPGLVRIRVGFRGEYDDWFELLMVGEEELIDMLKPTGWRLKRIYRSEGANYIAILAKKS